MVADIGDWATWVGSIAAVGTAAAGIIIGAGLHGRERRQALAQIHRDLTTGEVEYARHVIGTVLYGKHGLKKFESEDVIRAYFVLLFAVERVGNLKLAMGFYLPSTSDKFLRWNLDEVVNNIIVIRNLYGEKLGIMDETAWSSFQSKLRKVDRRLHKKYFLAMADSDLRDLA
ncbi:hypothetical protein ACX3O0_08890 [Homoserinimonas sp. A447]